MTGSLVWTVSTGTAGYDSAVLDAAWRNDPTRNPFCAPAFLRVMAETGEPLGRIPVIAAGRTETGTVEAVWPLALSSAGMLSFVQHEYAHHCTAVASPTVEAEELGRGLARAIREVRPAGLALVHLVTRTRTLEAVRHAVKLAGWRARIFPALPCPVLSAGSPAELRRTFARKSGRRRWNRLRRDLPDVGFEVETDPENLEIRSEEIARAHVARWEGTETPSMYVDGAKRELLTRSLKAWARDGILILFSLRNAEEGLVYFVALRAADRIVASHIAVTPGGLERSAGTALTWLAVCWCGDNGFRAFDFGIGGEAYKYRYANTEESLWRAFGGRTWAARAYLRGVIEEGIRRTPALRQAWEVVVNRQLRDRVRKARLARSTARRSPDA